MVPHFRLKLNPSEKESVLSVLESGKIAQGELVQRLETILANQLHKKYGCAVSSGTTALILALKALGIKAGDEVIIPSYTCTALWHAIKAVEATPVFCDIEEETFNLNPEGVRKKVSHRTRAIIFPHMFGQPGYIEELSDLGIPIIEDIAQAYGTLIDQNPVGSFGTITVTSFYATKPLGAGEGGAVFTDDIQIIEKIRDWREYDEKDNLIPRFNAKMTDIEAALALARIENFPEQIKMREKIFLIYKSLFSQYIQIPAKRNSRTTNYYRCIAALPSRLADNIISLAVKEGVNLKRPVYKPIHSYLGKNKLPITEHAWRYQFSIPLFPNLEEKEIETICKLLIRLKDYA